MIGAFVAQQIVGYSIDKGLDHVFRKKPNSYKPKLELVINKTIDDFSSEYPIAERDEKFPFYKSQIIIDELLKYRFFKNNNYLLDENRIKQELLINPYILVPKNGEIEIFLQLFEENLKAEKELKPLAVEENYKAEIFNIAQKFTSLFEQLDRVERNTEDIKKLIEEKVTRSGEIPKELTEVHRRAADDIVGRADDLNKIRNYLLSKHETVLLNGMGGIGKTTLAEVYVESFYNEYNHIVWISVEDNFKDAVLSNYILLQNLRLESDNPEQQFSVCLNELSNLGGPNLLVIDNAKQNLTKYFNQLPKAKNWHVLITSRERIEPFNIMDIDFLSTQDAIDLFKKYCADYSEEQILTVVEKVELHTLTIEVLAKAAKRNKWIFEECLGALGFDAKVNVAVSRSNYKRIERIKSYLVKIFNAGKLDEQEKWILKQFTALPPVDIDYDFLYRLLQVEKLDWEADFPSKLEGLYESGFLQKNIKKGSYKLHAVLNEVTLATLKPSVNNINPLINTVTYLLNIDQAKDNPIEKFPFVPFGDAIIELFPNINNSALTPLKNNLGLVYKDLGKYEKARDLLEDALKSALENFGKKHPSVAISKSNLGLVYKDLGEYEKARDLLEDAYEIFDNSLGKDHLYTKGVLKFIKDIRKGDNDETT
ncbi:MAG: tetratricopeptide repeat protein [Bacteroidetes bacterium]|nr:tetratricopeptide repeat protein [Bacteroidota bacterium]